MTEVLNQKLSQEN